MHPIKYTEDGTKLKICSRCKKWKVFSEYYYDKSRKDGVAHRCRQCCSYIDCKSKYRDRRKNWNKEHKERMALSVEKWHKNNPQKIKAHIILHNAIREGIIHRQPCKICGSEKSHGHHPDYNKPLEVFWLCPVHHKATHFGKIILT